jgi:hypothetical protein
MDSGSNRGWPPKRRLKKCRFSLLFPQGFALQQSQSDTSVNGCKITFLEPAPTRPLQRVAIEQLVCTKLTPNFGLRLRILRLNLHLHLCVTGLFPV